MLSNIKNKFAVIQNILYFFAIQFMHLDSKYLKLDSVVLVIKETK
jgi:hypothetical protein